jgi:F-type H+-transporting ATPase subunit epsilon
MEKLRLEILTPDNAVLETDADFVSVPGLEGVFGVLPGHVSLLAALGVGHLHYINGEQTSYVCLAGGFAEVADNRVRILADSSERLEDIDLDRAEKARTRALERLQRAGGENVDIARAEAALERAINRINARSGPG